MTSLVKQRQSVPDAVLFALEPGKTPYKIPCRQGIHPPQAPESGTPFRVVATLAPEQAVTLSVPRGAGEPSVDVCFVRRGEKIEMNVAGVSPHLAAQGDRGLVRPN